MVTVLEWGIYAGLKVLDIVWPSWAVFPVQCSGSETSSGLWHSMSDICGRSGKCGIECNYAFMDEYVG